MAENQMNTETLVNMIDSSVMDLESHGLAELVSEFSSHAESLLRSAREDDFQLALKAVRAIGFSSSPEPLPIAIKLLLDVGFSMMPRGKSQDALPLIERAIDLAAGAQLKAELRRAYSVYGALSSDAGFPARGIECALRAIELATELNDDKGIVTAQSNLTIALCMMGLYRESIDVAIQAQTKYGDDERFRIEIAAVRTNMVNACIALQMFERGASEAEKSADAFGLPRDSAGIFRRLVCETNWLKCAIGLGNSTTARARLEMVRGLAAAFKTPRTELNCELAEAAYAIHDGDLTIAVARLLKLLDTSKSMPTLYRDNLVLLVRAYEKAHDHTGVLIYLGKLVEFLAKSQVDNVKRALDALKVKVQTPMPGKDDVQDLIAAIQRDGQLPRQEIEVPEPMYRDAYERLAVTAELREDTWGKHAYRVGRLAYLLAEELGYGHRFCEEIELAARLHDIGKLGIPDGLLLKPGKLTDAEFEIVKRHTSIGAQLLSLCPNPAFRMAETIAVGHHEKWDGTGYPSGLAGEAIPLAARIATVADVYDALTHVRAYKHAWKHAEAVSEIQRMSGVNFEPRIVDAFTSMIDRVKRKHGRNLEPYLAAPSAVSTLVQARREMQEMLEAMYRIDEEMKRNALESMDDPEREIPQKLATEEEQKLARKPPPEAV